MTKVSIQARYASWVNEEQPTRSNFNRTGYVAVDGTPKKRKQALVWFSNPFGPDGGNVLKATLTLKSRKITKTGTHTVSVGVHTPWNQRFAGWNFKTVGGVAGTSTSVSKTGALAENTPWTFDVTKQMQAVADGQGMYGFLVYSAVAETLLFQGQMGGGLNPTLEVEWTMAPKPPTGLAPSGGRSVSEPKPTLRWNFLDHAGNETLNAVQVQISASANFATPIWDSGAVSTHWCSMDLSTATPAFGGVASGRTVYWRVRNQDGAGLWSGWSGPQAFRYDPLPTVTLQNPGPLTPYLVDPTPPIDWTVSGGTQDSFRVGIYVWDGKKWGLQAASGIIDGAATSWTPSKPLKYRNALYRVVVDIFDGKDREATPGRPDYASDYEEVRFIPDGDTTSAYRLTAKSTNGSPSVDITWDQTQQPDRWEIYRDGKHLASYPGDRLLRRAAPHYGITDRWVPQGKHTWQVFAIANGRSWPSAITTATVNQTGTWLVNEDTQEAVCFVGDTDHDMTMPEEVTVHYPLGSHHGVAITGAQRGYEGTVKGVLVDLSTLPNSTTQNAQVWHDNLLKFKKDVGQEYTLLIEELALPVQISNVDISGQPGHAGEAWQASFAFRQVGNWLWE